MTVFLGEQTALPLVKEVVDGADSAVALQRSSRSGCKEVVDLGVVTLSSLSDSSVLEAGVLRF